MKGWWMPIALVAGIYIAVKLTKFINYFTFGENREKRENCDKCERDKPE